MTDEPVVAVAPLTEAEQTVAKAAAKVEQAQETVAEAVKDESEAVAEAVVADAVPEILNEAVQVASRSTEELWRQTDSMLSEISGMKELMTTMQESSKELDNTLVQPLVDQITALAKTVEGLSKSPKPEAEASTTIVVPEAPSVSPVDPEKAELKTSQTPVCRIW